MVFPTILWRFKIHTSVVKITLLMAIVDSCCSKESAINVREKTTVISFYVAKAVVRVVKIPEALLTLV